MIKKRLCNFTFLLVSIASLTACNGVGTADFGETARETASGGTSTETNTTNASFSGIDSIGSVTDTSAVINWSHSADFVAYLVFNTSSGTVYVSTFAAPTASYSLSGLTPGNTYSYRVRGVDSEGNVDTNTNDVSFTTNSAPDAPSGLALNDPASSPAFDQTPTITISGVKSGDTIRLFTDSSCSTQVGSAASTGITVNITTSSLSAGSYTFYANATGTNTSSCSTANVSYTLNSCPTGYIYVPANAGLGVSAFCVMKYEAKNDGSGNAVSQEASTPWVSINQTDAWDECDDLNSESSRGDIDSDTNTDGTYALISNPEWITIARNVENVAANWTDGSVGSGCLMRGNVGATNACTGGDSGYNGLGPDFGSGRSDNGTASLTLDNGEEIWDLSGNVWEWVDWDMTSTLVTVTPANKAYISSEGSQQSAWKEFVDLDTNIAGGDEMFPDSWQATDTSLQGSDGIGRYYAGNNSSGGAARRGGRWSAGTRGGAFALALHGSPSDRSSGLGFRCVYRP
jgi:hypothetical protein